MLLPSLATAQAGKSRTFIQRFTGDFADASFVEFDVSGCVGAFVSVGGFRGKSQFPPGGPALTVSAIVSVTKFDFCTGTALFSSFGALNVDPSALTLTGSEARLAATVPVFDFVSNTSVDAVVNMAWSAVGPAFRINSHSSANTPCSNEHTRASGVFRPAEATGTVLIGGVNWTRGASTTAQLSSSANGMNSREFYVFLSAGRTRGGLFWRFT